MRWRPACAGGLRRRRGRRRARRSTARLGAPTTWSAWTSTCPTPTASTSAVTSSSTPRDGQLHAADPPRILVLSARDRVEDRIAGLDHGADDYLVKPFALGELTARVRRCSAGTPPGRGAVLRWDDLELDAARHQAAIGGQRARPHAQGVRAPAILPPARQRGAQRRAAARARLGRDADPFTNTVRVTISNLRRKLAEAGDRQPIETVTGRGYRLRGAGVTAPGAADRAGRRPSRSALRVAAWPSSGGSWLSARARTPGRGRPGSIRSATRWPSCTSRSTAPARRSRPRARRQSALRWTLAALGVAMVPLAALSWVASGRWSRSGDDVDGDQAGRAERAGRGASTTWMPSRMPREAATGRHLQEVVHELRTPLAVAATNLDLATTTPASTRSSGSSWPRQGGPGAAGPHRRRSGRARPAGRGGRRARRPGRTRSAPWPPSTGPWRARTASPSTSTPRSAGRARRSGRGAHRRREPADERPAPGSGGLDRAPGRGARR